MTTLGQYLREAVTRLPEESARVDVELLLMHVLDRSRSWLFAHADAIVQPEQQQAFEALLRRRQRGEPVAQIIGHREFWSLDLAVSSDTLIPRPETELLVELALDRLPRDASVRVLDLGTGTGAIALALAHERPRATVFAVDASAGALLIARKNAAKLGLGRITFLRGDWFSPVRHERFDLIVSNPPYLADDDPHLTRGDLRFEPRSALASGADGLDAIRRIAGQATAHLEPQGWLLVEHGWQQGVATRKIFAAAGLTEVETLRDLEARDRVTIGRHA